MNVRFLQKQGVDEPVAVSGVGLNTIAGVVGHITLIGRLHRLGGERCVRVVPAARPEVVHHRLVRRGGGPDRLDGDPREPPDLHATLLPIVIKAFGGVSDVLRRPRKVVMLVGGSSL